MGPERRQECRPEGAPALSVVVCTLDRADLLRRALASLAQQTAPPGCYEVIVVDNGSEDETPQVADEFLGRLPVRYVREERTGLSHARNRGCREARGRYVAYLDDDATARADWVESICRAVGQEAPDILGGPHFAEFVGPRPDWFPSERESWYPGEERRALRTGEYVVGVNMVVRKAFLEEVGGFRTDLGMAGRAMGYGEDSELQVRARRLRPDACILYCPDVVVNHLVRPEQARLWWYLRRAVREGAQAGRIYDEQLFFRGRFPRLKSVPYAAGHLGLAALRVLACPLRDRRRWPHWRAYVLLKVLPHVYSVFAHGSFALSRLRGARPGAGWGR
jgi:glycosyltransferase involved in cell wall biosynthesis